MNKSTVLIVVLILLILGFVAGWYFLSSQDSEEGERLFGLFPTQENTGVRERQPVDIPDNLDNFGDGERFLNPLEKVTERQVAGAGIFASSTTIGTSTTEFHIVRFVEMGTGHIYEANLASGQVARISNTTIRKTNRAYISNDGNYALIQYEDEFTDNTKNFVTYLSSLGESGDPNGEFLPENIASPDFSPNGEELAYVIKTNEGADIVIYSTETRNNKVVYSSPTSEWLISWVDNDTLALNTSPSYSSPGYAYTLSINTGTLAKVLGYIAGLNSNVAPDSEIALYSYTSSGRVSSRVWNDGDTNLNLRTFPHEKCVWPRGGGGPYCAVPQTIPSGLYPDDWYMGIATFADQVWRVDINSGFSTLLISPDTDNPIDVRNIMVSENEEWVLMENKKDFSLWVANLSSLAN